MGRVLFLLAAIPLVLAGYLMRDDELVDRAHLFLQAHVVGSGATDVVRPAAAVPGVEPPAPLPSASSTLFQAAGKQPRADMIVVRRRDDPPEPRPEVMMASLTPQSEPGSPFASANSSINRSVKGPLLAPPAGSQVLLSQTSPSAPGFDAQQAGLERASAAILMMAPTSTFGFVEDEDVSEPDPIVWPGRLHLASLKAEDGTALFGGFTEEEFRARELRCMTAAIYFEARGESRDGQIAVAQVVMNRVRANVYPDTICGVIFQGQWNRNACQFSFACDGKADRPNNEVLWERSKALAREVMQGQHWLTDVGYATHYHASYVRPPWARRFERVKQIGQHIFYKAPNIRVRIADAFDSAVEGSPD